MDLTLLILSVASVVIAVTTIVLLVVVLRHLGRHRRELAALRATAEAHDAETSGGGAQGGSSETSEASAEGDSLRRVAVVLNPSKFEETDTFRRKITDAVQRIEGAEVVFYETSIDDPGKGQTEQAVADGADLVMAAGGDGTVRLVASVLAGTDTRMGIIPAGTGNLLARNVEVPLEDPTAAMVAALTGTDRQVDVGWLRVGDSMAAAKAAERQVFLVIAGFGADAEMIGYTDPEMKKRIGWVAYIFGGIRTVLGRSVDVVVQLPDEKPSCAQGAHGAARQRGQAARRLRADAGCDDRQREARGGRGRLARCGRFQPGRRPGHEPEAHPEVRPEAREHGPLPDHGDPGDHDEAAARAARR